MKKKLLQEQREKAIIESFAKTFNKIKRIDENALNVATHLKVGDRLEKINTASPDSLTIVKIEGDKLFVKPDSVNNVFQWTTDSVDDEIKRGKLKWFPKNEAIDENEIGTKQPDSITVKLLPNWLNHLKSIKSGNLSGHSIFNSDVELKPNMLVKIGSGPYEMEINRRRFFWAEYQPQFNEITIYNTFCFGSGIQTHERLNFSPANAPQMDFGGNEANKNGCMFRTDTFSKFRNGFKIGEIDEDGYFEIIAVK